MSPSLTAHCPTAIYFSSPRRESSTVPTASKTVLITGANTGIGKEIARSSPSAATTAASTSPVVT